MSRRSPRSRIGDTTKLQAGTMDAARWEATQNRRLDDANRAYLAAVDRAYPQIAALAKRMGWR